MWLNPGVAKGQPLRASDGAAPADQAAATRWASWLPSGLGWAWQAIEYSGDRDAQIPRVWRQLDERERTLFPPSASIGIGTVPHNPSLYIMPSKPRHPLRLPTNPPVLAVVNESVCSTS